MITYTDGTRFNGMLKKGQVFVKGSREKTIIDFDHFYMYYQTKTDKKHGTVTAVLRSTFRKWLGSGGVKIKMSEGE